MFWLVLNGAFSVNFSFGDNGITVDLGLKYFIKRKIFRHVLKNRDMKIIGRLKHVDGYT